MDNIGGNIGHHVGQENVANVNGARRQIGSGRIPQRDDAVIRNNNNPRSDCHQWRNAPERNQINEIRARDWLRDASGNNQGNRRAASVNRGNGRAAHVNNRGNGRATSVNRGNRFDARTNTQPRGDRFGGNNMPRGNNKTNRENPQVSGQLLHVNNRPRDKILDFRKLKIMTQSEQELSELILDKNGFPRALSNNDLYSKTESFQDIVEIILKTINFNENPVESMILLIKVKSSSFFLEGFSTYYSKLMSKFDAFIDELTKTAFLNSVKLLKLIIEKFPSSLEHIFSPYALARLINERHDNLFGEEAQNIIKDLTILIENAKQGQVKVQSEKSDNVFPPPPENFRELGIFPDFSRDLFCVQGPYLRPIKINEGFQDVEQYLDVHFRLLREDFVGPLRKGIKEYLKTANDHIIKPKLTEVRIYSGVQVLNAMCHHTGLIHKIKFDNGRFKKVNWMTSKRFIYGSLLCLSNDKFENVILATVEDRKPKDLMNGYLYVKFENESKVLGICAADSFVMLETTAFFESYRHVLEALISLDGDKFPFKDSIVKCLPVIKPPNYLSRFRARSFKMKLERVEKEVQILDDRSWPTAESFGLDEAQLEALKNSLRSEVSVVQGPPGTGKTFLGLKIVDILMDNWDHWNEDERPILVVCYTNHALDQFLEGISKFMKEGIIRVGGRCKNEALTKFNLRELRYSLKNQRKIPNDIMRRKGEIRHEMEVTQAKIEKVGSIFEVIDKGLIHETHLRDVMTENQFYSLHSVLQYGNSYIAMWLQIHNEVIPNDDNQEIMEQQDSEDENIEVENEADLAGHHRRIDVDLDLHLRFRNLVIEEKRKKYVNDAEKHLAVNVEEIKQCDKDDQEWQTQKKQRKNNAKKIKKALTNFDVMSQDEACAVVNVWNLMPKDKWRLYRYWIKRYLTNIKLRISDEMQLYNKLAETLKMIQSEEDKWIMREAKIIGMTTTGAARHRNLLNSIKPKVVIVEEAAEVLESHVIASISPDCQHLILIGDHRQLRPSTNVYQLGRKYNLNCSLFERLIKNDYPFVTLKKQHRMRPQIADFARITYPLLEDDDSVMHYDNIRGVNSNVFFMNHHELEQEDKELMSATNTHEATFIARFCRYLSQQGYSNDQITILTPYTGQMFEIKKFMPLHIFKGVRICPVDNYQGEENDIILLSLVRSNDNGKIGFLKEDNRLNVALTRAKIGLYVIGNFDMLKNKSDFVNKIYASALQRPSPILGMKMMLCCQNHPNTNMSVSHAGDFDKVPEGGCSIPCRYRLKCGHTCTKVCHPYDKDHSEFKCLKECQKVITPCQHKCTKKCHETCGKCEVKVLKMMARCRHVQTMKCHQDPDKFFCQDKCDVILSCGHPCDNLCGDDTHTDQCMAQMTQILGCDHKIIVPCFRYNDDDIECDAKCMTTLECGHICTGTCGKCFGGRVHVRCKEKCNRSLVCGHKCRSFCSEVCPPCEIKCQTKCSHSNCSKKCGEKCDPCNEECSWNCIHCKCSKLCHEACNRDRCNNPCPKKLKCGHLCIGLCGEKCPSLCRTCHAEVLTEIFFGTEDDEVARFIQLIDCPHVLEVNGLDSWVSNIYASEEIVPLSCPKCKTPIQNNNRYRLEIKSIRNNIEKVKSKMRGCNEELKRKKSDVASMIWKIKLDEELDIIDAVKDENISLNQLMIIECAVKLMSHIIKIEAKFSKIEQQAVAKMQKRLLQNIKMLSGQEIQEIKFEITRLELLKTFRDIDSKITNQSYMHRFADEDKELFYTALEKLKNDKLDKTTENEFRGIIKKISPLLTGLGITEVERIQILGALNDVKRGAWFECPNGHVYAIGDCGGATTQSRCNECGAEIGGSGHALRRDNRWNTAMDRAQTTAWPGTLMNPNPPA